VLDAGPCASSSAIAQRHAIYRRLARRLRDDPALPASLRAVRFFAAAAKVSGPAALGALRARSALVGVLVRLGVLDAESWRHLEAINARLLAANLAVLERLLGEQGGPRSPLAPDGPPLTALAFDEAMVVFEQRLIDDYLREHAIAPAAQRGIDALLALCGNRIVERVFALDLDLCHAVRAQRRAARRRLSFFALDTRVAIGRQLVRRLHDAS
jgi:hypothetical protein